MFDSNDQNQAATSAAPVTGAAMPTVDPAAMPTPVGDAPAFNMTPLPATDTPMPTVDPAAMPTPVEPAPVEQPVTPAPAVEPTVEPTTNDAPADASAAIEPVAVEQPTAASSASGNDLISIKQQALQNLSPLLSQLDQTPEEKFRTTMMMIQASDDQSLIQAAYDAANAITDEKVKAQALLDVVNEINYFTQAKGTVNPANPAQ